MPGKYSVRIDTHCPVDGAALRLRARVTLGGAMLAAILALLSTTSAYSDTAADAKVDATNVATTRTRAANDFPTLARVEYVQECINRTGGQQNHMYQCACVVDRLAEAMSYDEFVESSTYAKYSTLPGEGGGIFRDTDEAKTKAKRFKSLEEQAFRACNLKSSG